MEKRSNEAKISIIVPVYNTSLYLEDCIDSVLKQTFQAFELLLINDGSTDTCGELCVKFCNRDSRIRLLSFHSRNGVSFARNRGIDIAKGKYLFFLDSDDMLHPALLEQVCLQAEKTEADMAMTALALGEYMPPPHWHKFCASPYYAKWHFLSGNDALNKWFRLKGKDSIGGKLFLRDAIHGLRFDEDITCSEDSFFNYTFLHVHPRKVIYTNNPGYYYRYRTDSAWHQLSLEKIFNMIEIRKRQRDAELLSDRKANAIIAEQECIDYIKSALSFARENDTTQINTILTMLEEEKRNPLFQELLTRKKMLLFICKNLYPLYKIIRASKDYLKQCKAKAFHLVHFQGRKE